MGCVITSSQATVRRPDCIGTLSHRNVDTILENNGSQPRVDDLSGFLSVPCEGSYRYDECRYVYRTLRRDIRDIDMHRTMKNNLMDIDILSRRHHFSIPTCMLDNLCMLDRNRTCMLPVCVQFASGYSWQSNADPHQNQICSGSDDKDDSGCSYDSDDSDSDDGDDSDEPPGLEPLAGLLPAHQYTALEVDPDLSWGQWWMDLGGDTDPSQRDVGVMTVVDHAWDQAMWSYRAVLAARWLIQTTPLEEMTLGRNFFDSYDCDSDDSTAFEDCSDSDSDDSMPPALTL